MFEGDVAFDAAGADAAFRPALHRLVPGPGLPPVGADVQVVADADDPDRRVRAQRAVPPERGDAKLVGGAEAPSCSGVQLVIVITLPVPQGRRLPSFPARDDVSYTGVTACSPARRVQHGGTAGRGKGDSGGHLWISLWRVSVNLHKCRAGAVEFEKVQS